MRASLAEIAEWVNGEVTGDSDLMVSMLSPIENIEKGSLVYAESAENVHKAETSDAIALLVHASVQSEKKPLIKVANPLRAFITILEHYKPVSRNPAGIHPTAIVSEGVQLGEHVTIGPYVVIEAGAVIGDRCVIKSHVHIGENAVIGKDAVLHPHVTVYDHCRLGSRVIIHSSTVIGSDGFGYKFMDGKHLKLPHIGYVDIADDVEIGSNTSIDRATLGRTSIGEGSKIDNHVQIAHSVKIGKQNIICAFTGIAGSTTSGDNVIFAANVGVSDHVRIDNNVILGARTGVPPNKHLREGNIYLGSPSRPKDKAIENELSLTRIPGMRKNMKALSEKIKDLNQRVNQLEVEENT